MKRLLLSLIVITAVSATALQVSSAFFSDTEESTDNTFTAGRLDLLVNDENDPETVVNINDLKPGDNQIVEKHLSVDFNPANIFLHLKDLQDSQGEQTQPE